MPCISKYKAHILKYKARIFSLLPCGFSFLPMRVYDRVLKYAFVCKKHVQRGGYAARGWGGVMVSVRRSRTINQSGSRRIRSIPFQCRARSRATLCRKFVA